VGHFLNFVSSITIVTSLLLGAFIFWYLNFGCFVECC
jgi:hypothetical protein